MTMVEDEMSSNCIMVILIRFIAARVRKTFHELHLLTPSLLFLTANQVSVGYGDKIGGLNMHYGVFIRSYGA